MWQTPPIPHTDHPGPTNEPLVGGGGGRAGASRGTQQLYLHCFIKKFTRPWAGWEGDRVRPRGFAP